MKATDLFDDWARRGRAEGMETGHQETVGALLNGLPLSAGTRFLDLGCGNGWAARRAAARGASCAGIDGSAEMVARADAAAAEDGVGGACRFQVADMQELPFDDGAFDIVWSMEAIYYARDVHGALAEARRVLQDSGVAHFMLDHYAENQACHGWQEEMGVCMVLWPEAQWVDALVGAGFADAAAVRLKSIDPGVDDWKRTAGTLYLRAVV